MEPDLSRFAYLHHPPSLVDLSVDGSGAPELRIDGYVGDKRVVSRRFSPDTAHDRLQVRADDKTIAADGRDATRMVFCSVDRFGAPRPFPTGDVTLSVDGPGVLVGDNPFGFEAAGGVGAVWVTSSGRRPGTIKVAASHPTLGSGSISVRATS